MDYTNTFNRKEVKYRLDSAKRDCLMEAFECYLRPSEFGTTRVNSLYLDTEDHRLIARSIEKPLYKEKIRIRTYGDEAFENADVAYLEIKKKYKGIVYKRRVAMTNDDAIRFIDGEKCFDLIEESRASSYRAPKLAESKGELLVGAVDTATQKSGIPKSEIKPNDFQIAREIDAFVNRYDELHPSALISCTRSAFEQIDDDNNLLRITFDTDLSALDLLDEERPIEILGDDETIMEIKCLDSYPLWLVQVLGHCGVYPRSFSKYGEMFEKRGF